MKKLLFVNLVVLGISAVNLAPVYAGWKPSATEIPKDQEVENLQVSEVITNFINNYPNLDIYFKKAYGYAIFPTVTKGAIGIGAAYGKGEVYEQRKIIGTVSQGNLRSWLGLDVYVYEQRKLIGTVSLTQVTIGVQFGGQAYSEIIFFKDQATLEDFKSGNIKLGARASAVASNAGVASDADYDNGVAVYTLTKNGLMYEASVGGQKFRFQPITSQ